MPWILTGEYVGELRINKQTTSCKRKITGEKKATFVNNNFHYLWS